MPLPGDRLPHCLGPRRAALQPRGLDNPGQPLRLSVRKSPGVPWALTQATAGKDAAGGRAGHAGEPGRGTLAGVPFPGGSAEPCLPPRRAHPCAPASPAPAGPADGGRGGAFRGSRRVSHAGPWALPPLLTPSRPRTEPLRPAGGRAAPRLASPRPGPARPRPRPGLALQGGGAVVPRGRLGAVWQGLGDRLGLFPGWGRDLFLSPSRQSTRRLPPCPCGRRGGREGAACRPGDTQQGPGWERAWCRSSLVLSRCRV